MSPAGGSDIKRAAASLRERGIGSTGKLVLASALTHLSSDETHIWYGIDLHAGVVTPAVLPDGFVLRSGEIDDLDTLSQLQRISRQTAQSRLDSGAKMWLVMTGSELAFSAWTFVKMAPFPAAPNGVFELPPRVAMLEDSVAGVKHRGAGVTISAVPCILEQLGPDYDVGLTPIHDDNVASRKAAEKIGFRPIATSRHIRRLGNKKLTVSGTRTDGQDEVFAGTAAELSLRIAGSAG